ncbi:MAG: M3 family metallopeptidase, partial [Planctomycetaceae bacterium]|nr:M3 family metallopeptidase [Planctomycetaceae bacterium]
MPDNNPLLQSSGFPAFDAIRAEHVDPAVDEILNRASQYLREAEAAGGDWDALMRPLEQIDLLFEYGWSPVNHLLSVANSEELREAHEAVLPRIVEFSLSLKQSRPLYEKFLALRDSKSATPLSSAQQRILRNSILSAEQSGIALEGADRDRFNEIARRLSQLSTDFSNHVLDATKAWHMDVTDAADADGLPESLRRMAAAAWSAAVENSDAAPATADNGPWRIKLEAPSFGPFMEHCRNRELREQAYRAYIARASNGDVDNTPLIEEILSLRQEKCRLLGYANFAELSLSRKMAGSVAAVDRMFHSLLDVSLQHGQTELDEITQLAHENGHEGPLAHWDISFWAERLREQRYAFTDEQLRPYFSLERVLDGLYQLCERLFGISVRPADGRAPVWHPDVRYFEVFDERQQHIAGFYLDPYSRPENKRGGAWMDDCITRSATGSELRRPVAHLVCNGTPPVGDTPSLMTFREVETLFHEFGHGLQHMLTTIDLRDAA